MPSPVLTTMLLGCRHSVVHWLDLDGYQPGAVVWCDRCGRRRRVLDVEQALELDLDPPPPPPPHRPPGHPHRAGH